MGLDYYAILGVGRSASASAINLAYRTLARACHPMRGHYCPDQMPILTIPQWRYWELICEAYEVLSDAARRHVYDSLGEEGLHTSFASQDGTVGYTFSGDCDRIYNEAMEAALPNEHSKDGGSSAPFWEKSTLPGQLVPYGSALLPTPRKCAPKMYVLYMTLEEAFHGATKPVLYEKSVTHNGITTIYSKTMNVWITPGLLPGTKIWRFLVGDECDDCVPGDVVLEVVQMPHARFTRAGPALSATCNISLMQALGGGTINMLGIDGKLLEVELAKACTTMVVVFDGEGMPKLDGTGRGHLRVTFSVHFPRYIPPSARQQLVQVLRNCTW